MKERGFAAARSAKNISEHDVALDSAGSFPSFTGFCDLQGGGCGGARVGGFEA